MNTAMQNSSHFARPMTFRVSISWKMAFESMGVDLAEVTAKARLPSHIFDRADVQLTEMEYLNLWAAVGALSKSDDFTLDFVTALFDKALNTLTFTSICQNNFIAGVALFQTYYRLVSPLSFHTHTENDKFVIDIVPPKANPSIHYTLFYAHFALLVEILRRGLQRPEKLLSVTAPRIPDAKEAYQHYFGCPIAQGETYRLAIDLDTAQQDFLSASPKISEFVHSSLELRIKLLGGDTRFGNLTRTALFQLLPEGESGIDAVSESLHMGSRSLQRRLQEEGTSYREVLHMVRGELAIHYLTQTKRAPKEIGMLLGYDDPTSFYRAYQNWTGMTPETTRRFVPKTNFRPN